MYTDDYRKECYLDVQVSWIDRQFQKHHAALAVRHFGHRGSYWRLRSTVCGMWVESRQFKKSRVWSIRIPLFGHISKRRASPPMIAEHLVKNIQKMADLLIQLLSTS